jgi:hypothetical protein
MAAKDGHFPTKVSNECNSIRFNGTACFFGLQLIIRGATKMN